MANRRMICKDVVCSDAFIMLSYAAHALYMQLTIEADDHGFVGSPMKVMRGIAVTGEVMDELIDAGFVIRFKTGIIVITHWKRANSLKNDRQYPVAFPKEFAQLKVDENGDYSLLESNGIQNFPMESQPNLTQPNQTEPNRTEPNPTPTQPNTAGGAGGGDPLTKLIHEYNQIEPAAIQYAFDELAEGANNRYRYTVAILDRWSKTGITTLAQAKSERTGKATNRNEYDTRPQPEGNPFADVPDFEE